MQKFQHIINDEFAALADKLPPEIQRSITKQFQFLRTNPLHPSLRFKKVSERWSLHVSLRITEHSVMNRMMIRLHGIGLGQAHDEYEKKIK